MKTSSNSDPVFDALVQERDDLRKEVAILTQRLAEAYDVMASWGYTPPAMPQSGVLVKTAEPNRRIITKRRRG